MKKCSIIATTDVHGYISPYKYSDNQLGNLGIAKLVPLINNLRDENTILIDNGDTIQGSPLQYFHRNFMSDTPNPLAKVLNYIGYDYVNTGNHEFNYGLDYFNQYYSELDAKWITGNIQKNKTAFNKPYTIHETKNGIRLAFIGATTHYIPNWEQPNNIIDLTFEDAFTFVKNAVALAKEQDVDFIVVTYHGGFEKDLETHENTELQTGENQGYRMCTEIDGIDLLITGHQHRSIASKINNTVVTQSTCNGAELAHIELVIDGETKEIKPQLIGAKDDYDSAVLELIEEYNQPLQKWLDQPLGMLKEGDLIIKDLLDARLNKHRIVKFLNDVQMDASGVDISGIALANEVHGFNNEITMRNIVSTYVYPNTLVVLEMSGKILKEVLEFNAKYFTIEHDQIVVDPAYILPKPQHYNYDMYDGISYEIKVSNAIGNRIQNLTYHGEEVVENKSYLVVVNNYRASGGGNFAMIKDAKIVREIQTDMVELIANYISKHKVIDVDQINNIKINK